MNTTPRTGPSLKAVRAGQIISGLIALFLLADALGKVAALAPVVEGTARLGYPPRLVLVIGLIELLCTLAYLIPRSSMVGAILLTGYLGGAVATHLRVEDPLWTHALFPVYVGALVWGGLFLREARLRALIPSRSRPAVV